MCLKYMSWRPIITKNWTKLGCFLHMLPSKKYSDLLKLKLLKLLHSCSVVNLKRTIQTFQRNNKQLFPQTNCLLVCTGLFENCKSGLSRLKCDNRGKEYFFKICQLYHYNNCKGNKRTYVYLLFTSRKLSWHNLDFQPTEIFIHFQPRNQKWKSRKSTSPN